MIKIDDDTYISLNAIDAIRFKQVSHVEEVKGIRTFDAMRFVRVNDGDGVELFINGHPFESANPELVAKMRELIAEGRI